MCVSESVQNSFNVFRQYSNLCDFKPLLRFTQLNVSWWNIYGDEKLHFRMATNLKGDIWHAHAHIWCIHAFLDEGNVSLVVALSHSTSRISDFSAYFALIYLLNQKAHWANPMLCEWIRRMDFSVSISFLYFSLCVELFLIRLWNGRLLYTSGRLIGI